MATLDARLRAICDLTVPYARRSVGRHEYDGLVQDLSPDGVRSGLTALGGPAYPDPHDDAHATAAEDALRARFGELELHRVNPQWHIDNLDLNCYEREYAPAEQRRQARLAHLRRWPDAVDAAVKALDRVPAPLAEATLPAARGLAGGPLSDAALAAHARLIAHLEHAAEHGDPSAALGGPVLTRLMSSAEAMDVDLGLLATRADVERDRLRALFGDACRRIDPTAPPEQTMRAQLADHPRADQVVESAAAVVGEVIAWTTERCLVPYLDGECRVGRVSESQPWQVAEMAGAAPYEADAPSWFRVNPPSPAWAPEQQADWLRLYYRNGLRNIALHEVAPGHFSHSRALRRAHGQVRRVWQSEAFSEGWAHYCEEMALEEGFLDGEPRFALAVARDGLLRVTRLACAIGLHTGAMSVDEAARRFTADAFFDGPAAYAQANRALFDPAYGHYTWGKLLILDLRQRARRAWGQGFSLPRFHAAMLELGSPPLGLLDTALKRG